MDRHSVAALLRVAEVLGGALRIDLLVPGGDVHRLLDADHAQLQNGWKGLLDDFGWEVEAEVTFNHFGERGSIDLLAWHASGRLALVIEIKTAIIDVQALLAGLDRKVRIGRAIARERGWFPSVVVPVLIVAEGSTSRRRLAQHAALFTGLSLRGRQAQSWLRRPLAAAAPTGLLLLTKLSEGHRGDRRRAGRQRVRIRRA